MRAKALGVLAVVAWPAVAWPCTKSSDAHADDPAAAWRVVSGLGGRVGAEATFAELKRRFEGFSVGESSEVVNGRILPKYLVLRDDEVLLEVRPRVVCPPQSPICSAAPGIANVSTQSRHVALPQGLRVDGVLAGRASCEPGKGDGKLERCHVASLPRLGFGVEVRSGVKRIREVTWSPLPAAAAARVHSPQRLVELQELLGLLDDLRADFPLSAEVTMQSVGAVERIRQLGETLGLEGGFPARLSFLEEMVKNGGDRLAVAEECGALGEEIARAESFSFEPPAGMDTARARAAFDVACAACHGPRGAGDGPSAATLVPPPAAFQALGPALSVERVYWAVSFGVPETGMPAFPSLFEQERWNLAAYVLSLRASQAPAVARALSAQESPRAAGRASTDVN